MPYIKVIIFLVELKDTVWDQDSIFITLITQDIQSSDDVKVLVSCHLYTRHLYTL